MSDTLHARCPVCDAAHTIVLGRPVYRQPPTVAGVPIRLDDLDLLWRRCAACGYQFVHPGIPQSRLRECYSQASAGHWGTDNDHSYARSYAHKKRMLDRFSAGKRILDFGCFDGGFLAYVGDGYQKLGIEPASDAAKVAEQRGVTIIGATIADATAASIPFVDAVVSFDVFEHLSDPVSALRGFCRLLKPGGIVLIETGNSDEPLWRRVGIRHPYQSIPEHVAVFNESSLREAGRHAGLELVHFEATAHQELTRTTQAIYRLYNLAYSCARAWDKAGAPMPTSLKRVAQGPLPRSMGNDHFLAILRMRTA